MSRKVRRMMLEWTLSHSSSRDSCAATAADSAFASANAPAFLFFCE